MTLEPDRASAPESLAVALDRVYGSLDGHSPPRGREPAGATAAIGGEEAWQPFELLRGLFGLSPFERDLVVLCAGYNLESRFASTPAGGVLDDGALRPTFGLALTVLDDPHWSAVTPAGPLRYWQLLELGRGNLLDAPLHLDERILQFVLAVPAFDERLQALIRPLAAAPGDAPARHRATATGARHWSRGPIPREPIVLIGRHRSICESAFAGICQAVGLGPYWLDSSDLPSEPSEREQLARHWTREATLSGAALLLRTEQGAGTHGLADWLELVGAPVAVETRPGGEAEQLDGLRLHLAAISADERRALWSRDLGPLAGRMDGTLDRIADYFEFDEPAIRVSAARVREAIGGGEDADPGELCWQVCREHGRRSLEALAQRIEVTASWEDVVLPGAQRATLRQIATHVRRRATVNHAWGFAAKHARGLGLTVLFAGASGTGKTMAAEILAAELDLDLYKVDLASVVSKYIGETEKNLRAIFAGAQQSGAILLFDEADALFGKRSEVRDSHDRYANLEISYLLQQMEGYRGVAILTTNMEHALDPAFTRRIRFIVQFPFPDHAARASIWRGIFPAATPLGDVHFDQLAQLNVSGGAIRNIAMNAAFLAADDSMRVESRHIIEAAQREYAKLDKPLTPAETRGLT
jgi:ATPase family associated with various cellular activities (AAA)